jgi:anti-sigma regulatory factor (Ser/Thr protein kinase)
VWQVVKPLRPHPLAVGQARNFCTRRLSSVLDDRSGAPDVVADAATIASELVTNAVTAGSSTIELCLGLRPNSIYIEVADDADGAVTPAHPAPTDPKGRGLLVVAALSREWGVTAADGTKQVWAEIPLAALGDGPTRPLRPQDSVG